MDWLEVISIIVVVIIGCFSFVLLFGAPYLPTLKIQIGQALDLLDLQPGETMLELGCGDGRVLRAAAQRGWHVVGYELNPLLVIVARLSTWRYRRTVQIVWGDYWRMTWPPAAGIYGFILPRFMSKLDKKVIQWKHRPVKLVSFAFAIPSKNPTHTKGGVFRYDYR